MASFPSLPTWLVWLVLALTSLLIHVSRDRARLRLDLMFLVRRNRDLEREVQSLLSKLDAVAPGDDSFYLPRRDDMGLTVDHDAQVLQFRSREEDGR